MKTAREIARDHIRSGRGDIGMSIIHHFGTDLPDEEFFAWENAVHEAMPDERSTVSWPDERNVDPRDLFADVADITAWLDESNPASDHEDSMRVLKLVEEAGEAAAAYIGMVGQNPRKGVTHTQDDLLKELADVAITALCAMQHFTQNESITRAYMAAKVQQIIARSDIRVRAGQAAADRAVSIHLANLDRRYHETGA